MDYFETIQQYYQKPVKLELLGNTVGNSNGNWIDTSHYGIGATQSNVLYQPTLTDNVFGSGYKGYIFDAVDYMTVSDRDDFTFSSNGTDIAFTLQLKIKWTTIATCNIISKIDGSNYEWQTYYYSDQLRFYVYGQNSSAIYMRRTCTFTPVVGQTYILKFAYGGAKTPGSLNIYVDNQMQVGSTYAVGTYIGMSNTSTPIYIGKTVYNAPVGGMTDIKLTTGL
jgi:hypothetical protein